MTSRQVFRAADVVARAMGESVTNPMLLAEALEPARLLQSPETVAEVRCAALEEGAAAVEEMQTARDDDVNAVLGGLPDRVAIEQVTARKAAALLRRMAASGPAAVPQPETAPGRCGRALATGQPCPDHPAVPTEAEHLRARVAELEGQLAKYVGKEPTVAEEMAYLSRCLDAVQDLCDEAERQATRWEQPMPVPEWVKAVRKAAAGDQPRHNYPPALPWAALMDSEDCTEFLDELAASAITNASAEVALAEVEATCGRWRLIAEAQHAHNTSPGPDTEAGGAS